MDEITAKLQGMTVFTIANFKTHSTMEITTKFPSRDKVEHARHFPTSMEMCMDDHLTLTTEKIQQKQFQDKTSEKSCSTHSISPDSQKNTIHSHAEPPPGMENIPIFPGKQFLQGKEKFVDTSTFILKGKDIPVTDTFITDTLSQATPMNPENDIQLPKRKANMITTHILTCISTCILMNVQPQDSLSNKLD